MLNSWQCRGSRFGLKTGVENDIFWSDIGSGFGELGCTPLPRIPRSTLPPGRISLQPYWQIDNGFFNGPILVFTQVLIRRLEPVTRISALFRLRRDIPETGPITGNLLIVANLKLFSNSSFSM